MGLRRTDQQWPFYGGLGTGVHGVTVSSSGTANTKGSWTTLISSAPRQASGIRLNLWAFNTTAADALLDVGVGASGSEVTIFGNALLTNGAAYGNYGLTIPMKINAGDRVALRMQSSTGGWSIYSNAQLLNSPLETAAGFTTLGADISDSGGLQVDPGGGLVTYGSWITFSSGLPFPVGRLWVFPGVQRQAGTLVGGWRVDVGLGSPSPTTIVPEIPFWRYTSSGRPTPSPHELRVNIPANTPISVRSKANMTGSPARLLDIVLIAAANGPVL